MKMYKQQLNYHQSIIAPICVFIMMSVSCFAKAEKVHSGKTNIYEAENAVFIGGASKVLVDKASGGYLVKLKTSADGVSFTNLSSANKLAIKYTSTVDGFIDVNVNDQLRKRVNIHSTGKDKYQFSHSIIDIEIPNDASIELRLSTKDISVNVDQIITGNGDLGLPPDIWNLPELAIEEGPFVPKWEEMSKIYSVPEWWREAKLGAWAHWDPQSMPEEGDWYARGMYMQGNRQYEHHVKQFGHPSEYGYKDICNNWVIDRWEPEQLMNLFVEMGAKYFMAMGVHHDNYDCWDSKYQPWNSVNVGPKVDIVGVWEKIARKKGLRFGIGFHNTPARTWGQFMPVRYTSDKTGPKQGVPYDALQTKSDGIGKWWEGMDPVDLYGPIHTRQDDPLKSPFANQFMWRIDDAITKYHPDIIYFDEHAGDSQVDLGVHMGLGFLAPQLIANYYNKSLKWNDQRMEAVINLKGVGGRWDSFQNSPELLPHVDRSLVKSSEFHIEPEIMAYPFQTETSIAEWHYKTGMKYMGAAKVIELLLENVTRNGTMLLNLTQHGRGDLDPEVITLCKDVGAWLKVNGEAVYGSRPFEIYGQDSVYYTRNKGHVYAIISKWKNGEITLSPLHTEGSTIGKVSKVEMLGSAKAINFKQDEKGLTIVSTFNITPIAGISDNTLNNGFRVLRITHDKDWMNDDDPGVKAPGWLRKSNLGLGDYNNDLTISDTPGDMWTATVEGSNFSIIAPREKGNGKIVVRIDGITKAVLDLSNDGPRLPQQTVYEIKDLKPGKHVVNIINQGSGTVAIDALVVE